MAMIVIVAYAYFLLPARSRVATLSSERDSLQRQLRTAQIDFQQHQDTKTRVVNITDSLERFENERLVERGPGRMSLYEEINQLIHKNGLRNSSGPTYTLLDAISTAQEQRTAKSTGAKWQSIYPGIAVNVTVEGSYQSVRHFVRDIEASKGFIIINAVELERATDSRNQLQDVTQAKGSANALVSLRMDLATYFQRGEASGPESPAK
jgi:Tfp pilus assembly protein PilO